MPQRKTEHWLHLSDNDGQKLLSLHSFSADAKLSTAEREAAGGSDTGITPSSKSCEREREIRLTLSEPSTYSTALHYTNKHLKHSPQNKTGSICGCCVPCWRCQTSAERHSTLCLSQFYCLSYVRCRRICDLQANKNLIRGIWTERYDRLKHDVLAAD